MLHRAQLAAFAAIICTGLLGFSCGSDDDDPAPTRTAAPVASAPAGPAGAPPSPTGQASPRGVVEGAYSLVPAFPQLDFDLMLGLVTIPGSDTDAVVLTKDGMVYRTSLAEDAAPSVYLDISDRLIDNPGTEEGLLGLAFAPDFETSRRFYVYYTAGDPRRSVISRFSAAGDAADPASEQVILEVPQPFRNHNGGAMVFGPDNMLYIALGDGGSSGDPQRNGQNTNVLLGKILRIDVSGDGYASPPDNPFAAGGGLPEIFAYGLRNPWRITFDRETGDLWAGDVGQNSLEEVDRIVSGGNYGWNVMEGDECFSDDSCDPSQFVTPRAVYGREGGCSVTGGYVYRGSAMPELRGWYVYGDFCSGMVWAVDAASETSEPVMLLDSEAQISSFAVDQDGEIYAVSFDRTVYRLTRA